MPPNTRRETPSDKPEVTPDATPLDPAPAEQPAPAAEPDNPAQADPEPPASDDTASDQRVRLVPGDWTVTSVEFPTGEANEDGDVRVTVHREVPYLVSDAEADALIAAAASHGIVLTKEPVA